MTITERLGSWRKDAARRAERRSEVVEAVYDEDLWLILAKMALLTRLDAGELQCAITGVPLSRENLGGLIGSREGPKLISDEALLATTGELVNT
jgi:hypothetical protein